MQIVQCIDCAHDIEVEDGDLGFVCDHCNCDQEFLQCAGCQAISQVAAGMDPWVCSECGQENSNAPAEPAAEYVEDLGVEHVQHQNPNPNGVFGLHRGFQQPPGPTVVIKDGQELLVIPCPACPASNEIPASAQTFECHSCGGRFRFGKCMDCGNLEARDDVLGTWVCDICGGDNSPGGDAAVTAQEYAEALARAGVRP